MDIHKKLRVSASSNDRVYNLFIDGYVRTVQSTWRGQPWSASFLAKTYTICGVEEKVGGRLALGYGKKFGKCPTGSAIGTADNGIINTKVSPVKLLNVAERAVVYTDSNVLSQLYPHNPDVFIMKHSPAECAKRFSASPSSAKSFLKVFPS